MVQTDPPQSPELAPAELIGRTHEDVQRLAREKGLMEDNRRPNRYLDPLTGRERLRIDAGHPPAGPRAGRIVDPETGDPHFPLRPRSKP